MDNRHGLSRTRTPEKCCGGILRFFVLFLSVSFVRSEVLTPPYFNLAEGRRITASATCGEDIHGPELYCKLVGATSDQINHNLIQGQFCDYCDISIDGKSHPAQYAIDGSERWWQSPPLSRGMKYNEVNLTIDLGQEFHVAYVFITMANSPRPGIWVLERSRDNGKTYKPWQYFAETPGDCENFFGKDSLQQITRDDSVVCDTQYSRVVPLEGGEIVVSLLNNRPSSGDFFESDVLQEWTRATNIRLRLLRTKTLLGHLMSVARQDPTVTRRYFYSIKDISIGGRCRCNGHADLCDITDPEDVYKLLCRCQHYTCGTQCDTCCPGFVQKAWRPATHKAPFVCEPCNCFGHSHDCYYDAEVDRNQSSIDIHGLYDGGGVCQNCRHNTEGINCHKCRNGYYRPFGKALNATDVCRPCQCDDFSTGNCEEGTGRCECKPQFLPPNCGDCNTGYYDFPDCKPCDCHYNGTRGAVCHVGGGQCPCKQNFAGKNCDRCAEGFYKFPECLPCACDEKGSNSQLCDPDDGQCDCGNNFGGRQCHECEDGYYNFWDCKYCNCDVRGTKEGICDKERGTCICRDGYGGARCDTCLPSYYGYPDCRSCNCSAVGSSAATTCDISGKCPCLPNFSGRSCDQCRPGYYQYPDCLPCNCFMEGSMGEACDDEGRCQCKPNFDGITCNQCREGFYNHPLCEECNCDPAGVVETWRGCGNAPPGQVAPGELCKCKERVQGRICNECKPLFWNLQHYSPTGCEDCNCFVPGIIGGVQVCDGKTGQCPCKPHVKTRKCEQCQDSYYNLTAENLLGCTDCACDVGGAVNNNCDKFSGDCPCQPRVQGKTCKEPLSTHYFPTLYQFQYEAEDGLTKSGGPVRFSYDESIFPDYSWRGYAVYSQLQPETIHEVYIDKSSLYRVVLHYVNRGDDAIMGEITAIPENPNDAEQKYKVRFEPKNQFVTVSTGNVPSPFVLNPGRWHFSIKSNQYLLVDYFTLLPGAYYEGAILQKRVREPCYAQLPGSDVNPNPGACLKLKYPNTDKFDTVLGVNSHIDNNGDKQQPSKFFSARSINFDIETQDLVVLSPEQNKLNFNLGVSKSGRYALILDYFTPTDLSPTNLELEATSKKGTTSGQATAYKCQHTMPCRQVITNEKGEVTIFRFDQNDVEIILQANVPDGQEIAVHSITAIPLNRWSLDYIRPKAYCIFSEGACVESSYNLPPDSTKVEAETSNADLVADSTNLPPGVNGDGRKFAIIGTDNNKAIEIQGKVSNPGYYKFLIHYNQPENPDFTVDVVVQNGQHYEAKAPITHCPSIPGCRALISQDDRNSRFYVDDDFTLILKSPKGLWIDYVLAVPAPYENQNELAKFLEETPLDETRRFIAECGQNHMYLPRNTDGFCKDAVFSLTTDYNNGALPCQCDRAGSKSFECDQFGGQCNCLDNVIGRRCERCKTGYFGFPNCVPCDCPATALCDPRTGECICPPRVVGEKCNTCAPLTYGFDALIGCEECACSHLGVANNNLQCDLFNGSCTCKPNVVGRTCDSCLAGYWAFPYCQLCDCDVRGTTAEICNQESAQCHCKQNVEGRGCETCRVGNFNLEERNPKGCTSCFCFGKTQRCSSSSLFWTHATATKSQWSALSIDPNKNGPLTPAQIIGHEISFEDVSAEDGQFVPFFIHEGTVPEGNETNVLYFRADLNSNYLSSYGGKLTYVLNSDPQEVEDRETFVGPDVILEGRELAPSTKTFRIMHFAIDHLDGDHNMRMSLGLNENNFNIAGLSGGLVTPTREQLMILLKGLTSIYVRAGYWKKTREARLLAFELEVGTEEYSPDENALSVEQCQCPPNYQGLSCEECARGYYRSPSGPFGGYCIPCQCHGHSDSCDPVSGVCFDCRHNTTGSHCEQCREGYHGDATQGSPYDCLICACPLPITSNNFATSCELSQDGLQISCQCKENYWGPRCESCGPGYHGVPESPGDFCKPCDCSGNIDVNDPSSCDTVTGACLRCMNNTGGPACNLCARGYYGDALLQKDCKSCNCNECGTLECDSYSGDCHCLNNVIGPRCDRCAENHFGFSECDRTGCHYCDCGIAARSPQCDDHGQCDCKPGTAKPRCDRCAQGFWNFTEEGCQPCECNTEYAIGMGCDPEDGQCSCLEGVIGEKCDSCPHRWVLIENRGCRACDSCQHQLLDDTDRMRAILDPVKADFESVAVSYFTTQKLAYFNNTASMLKPAVDRLDPSKQDASPFYSALNKLELEAKTLKQKADVTNESLKEKAKTSLKLKETSAQVESKVQEAVVKARTAVFETKDLMEGLLAEEKLSSPQTEAALSEARDSIEGMKNVVFLANDTLTEKENASKVLNEVKEFAEPVNAVGLKVDKEAEMIANIREKLKDIRNQSTYSVETSLKANALSRQIKQEFQTVSGPLKSELAGLVAQFNEIQLDTKFPKIALLVGRNQEISHNVGFAADLNYKTDDIMDDLSDKSLRQLGKVHRSVKALKDDVNDMNDILAKELVDNKDTIAQSNEHARKLKEQADDLDDMFGDSESVSGHAFAAATSYQKMTDALNEALKKAKEAKQNAENTTQMTNGIGESAKNAMEPSRNLVILSSQSQAQVQHDLKRPLEDAKANLKQIDELSKRTGMDMISIATDLGKADNVADMGDIKSSIKTSEDASEKAQNILEGVEPVIVKLPNDEALSRQLPITVTDLNKAVEVSDNQLKQARESIPLSSAIADGLEQKKPDFDRKRNRVAENIENLKAQIKSAREQANRVRTGMNLMESSTLVLANPSSLDTQQVRTKISIYFKTREPNGVILFLGNEPGRKPETDFLAIEVDGGYPSLTVDLGSGPQQFVVKDKYVADENWYRATVDRIGRRVRFTVTEELQNGEQIDYVTDDSYGLGTKSLLNVDRNSSKLFVGGIPPGYRNPVKFSNYNGAVEDLVIGDEKVGLWNFKDAQNVQPAYGRDRFLNLKKDRGLRFLGNGYAIVERKFGGPLIQKSSIRLKFQTRARNGLIFLAGKGKKFMSLEIDNGAVVFQFNLGGGVCRMVTPETYNDGRWHTLQAVRAMNEGNLKIDNYLRGQNKCTSGSIYLAVSDYLYFGGYPGQHDYPEVTNKDFEGCIDNIALDLDVNIDQQIDLTEAVDTRDTMVGCPASEVEQHVATFYGGGYAKVLAPDSPTDGPVISHPSDEVFELNFRFRSNSSNGLIFYGADPKQENYISVSLVNGALVIKTEPGDVKVSSDALNDADWHLVTVTRDKNSLRVNVDDAYDYSEHAPDSPLSVNAPGSILLFGGRPEDLEMPSGADISNTPYSGCLADVNINGRKVDLTDAESKDSSVSQRCQIGEGREEPDSVRRLTIPQTDEDEGNQGPEVMTMSTTTMRPQQHVHTPRPQPPPVQPEEPDYSETIFPEAEEKKPTTTVKPRKMDDPTPTPYNGCKLPYRTKVPTQPVVSLADGIRFGNFDKTSRLEYYESGDDASESEYSIEFKTAEPDGIILMKTNIDTTDFIALYLLGGSVHFAFDSGAGMALLNTTLLYDDDAWHSVTIKRNLAHGELHLDGFLVTVGDSPGTTTMINAGSTLYVGGLSQPVWAKRFNTAKKIKYVDSPFRGCLKNLEIKGKVPGPPALRNSIEPCTEEGEKGFYFYPGQGFLRPADRFIAGRRIIISLSIKPRAPSGILLSVHGAKDYMVLQMVNGTVKFTVDNGKGVVSSSFTKDQYDLCDGQWHSIQVSKSKNVVTLSVDNTFAAPGIGAAGTDATDTKHPLYFGGNPAAGGKVGLETTEQFVGCMKDLHIETQSPNPPLRFTYETLEGVVALHTCPTD